MAKVNGKLANELKSAKTVWRAQFEAGATRPGAIDRTITEIAESRLGRPH